MRCQRRTFCWDAKTIGLGPRQEDVAGAQAHSQSALVTADAGTAVGETRRTASVVAKLDECKVTEGRCGCWMWSEKDGGGGTLGAKCADETCQRNPDMVS